MERVLDVYARPYDEQFPVLCFDEQPCFLIGDVLAPGPSEPGRVAKEDYEYRRFGSCAVLLAVEPKTGRRFAKVCARRTAEEYTAFMQDLERASSAAIQITLVQETSIRITVVVSTSSCRRRRPTVWWAASSGSIPPSTPLG